MNLAQISGSLILITAITIVTGEKLNDSTSNNYHLPNETVVPVHNVIQLALSIQKSNVQMPSFIKELHNFHFDGESRLTVNILHATKMIKFYKQNLHIDREVIELVDSNGIIYNTHYTFFNEPDYLGLYFSDVLFPGLYTLDVVHKGALTAIPVLNTYEDGDLAYNPYIINEKGIMQLYSPHFQVIGARGLFPCCDEPHFKATFDISIKHDKNFTVLSNMPTKGTYKDYKDNNLRHTEFHTTPPISTTQVSIVMTDLPPIRINANVSLWCEICLMPKYEKYVMHAMQVIENITLHLKSEFKEIAIPKMDHVAIQDFPYSDTSKWGLIFYREDDLTYNEELDPIMRKIEVARSIAPKIAYQWFCNAGSPAWWSHFWLHDGLATLFGEEAVAKIFNNSPHIMDSFVVQSQYDSLHLDSHLVLKPPLIFTVSQIDMNPPQINNLSQIESIFSFPRHMKVIVVLRMLQNAVSYEAFRKGVQSYLSKSTSSILAPDAFWSIQEEAANASYYSFASNDFANWITFKHYPIVTWTQEAPCCGNLTQHYDTVTYGKWWIPTYVNISSSWNIKTTLTPTEPSLFLDFTKEDDWVIVNIEQAGYYRVNYESENWRKLVRHLHSGGYNISVINRAKIIDDAFHLMMTRQLDVSTFWELTRYLPLVTDYAAWYPMIKALEYMSSFFPFSYDYETNFIHVKEKIRALLVNSLDVLGFEERPMENDLTKCLRQEIAKWACTLEYNKCLSVANYKLEMHLKDPESNKIAPGWKDWTYCNGLTTAKLSTWLHIIVKGEKTFDTQLIEYLPCSQDPSAVSVLLNFLKNEKLMQLTRNTTEGDANSITNQQYINIFHSLIVKHAKNEEELRLILQNLEEIRPREMSSAAAIIDVINHVYSNGLVHMIKYHVQDKSNEKYYERLEPLIYKKLLLRYAQIGDMAKRFQVFLN